MSRTDRSRRGPAATRRPVDGGAAAVELAIVLPILLLVMFGIIDLGRLMNQQITLTEAAREGARVGALHGSPADVRAKVAALVGAGVTLTYTGGTPTVCGTGSTAGADATVTVQRTFAPVTPLSGIVELLGGAPGGTIVIRATGGMSCIG